MADTSLQIDERLAEHHQSLDFDEPRPFVRLVAHMIVEQRVRAHLTKAATARPVFRGGEESAAVSLPTQIRIDVPGLDVSDRARLTTLGIWTTSRVHVPAQGPAWSLEHEHLAVCLRAKLARPSFEILHRVFGKQRRV